MAYPTSQFRASLAPFVAIHPSVGAGELARGLVEG